MIAHIESFHSHANKIGVINTDCAGGDYVKINWVFGGVGSEMLWYEPKKHFNKHMLGSTIETPFIPYKPFEVNVLHKETIHSPSVVQVGIPHSVINFLDPRLCVSVVIVDSNRNRISMQQAQTIFKNN